MIDNKVMSESERKQQAYYNKIVETYDRHYSNQCALKYRHGLYKNILKSINLENLRVLDAMCAGGQATGFLLKNKALVTGLDISEEQCEIYKKRYPLCEVVCSSIIRTEFPDSFFDLVVIDSLHHLHPHIHKGINEIYRILKVGGYFLLWEPCAKSLFDIFRKTWYKKDKDYFQENERSIDLKRILASHHTQFELTRVKYGGNFAYFFVHGSMLFRINPKIVRYYAGTLMALEKFLNIFQPSFMSAWVLALLQKKSEINEPGINKSPQS